MYYNYNRDKDKGGWLVVSGEEKSCMLSLDCAPGAIRPGNLLPQVIKDTGLKVKEPVATFFGCWTWDCSDQAEEYEKARATIGERVKALYNDDKIRFGSW
jgi:hypothetical protein